MTYHRQDKPWTERTGYAAADAAPTDDIDRLMNARRSTTPTPPWAAHIRCLGLVATGLASPARSPLSSSVSSSPTRRSAGVR